LRWSGRRGAASGLISGIPYEMNNISSVLEAIGCYEQRDSAIRKLFPEYSGN